MGNIDPDFEGRVLVVANRLPMTITPKDYGEFEYNLSSGGLVSGLKGFAKVVDFKWFGWPGKVPCSTKARAIFDRLIVVVLSISLKLIKNRRA